MPLGATPSRWCVCHFTTSAPGESLCSHEYNKSASKDSAPPLCCTLENLRQFYEAFHLDKALSLGRGVDGFVLQRPGIGVVNVDGV